MDPDKRRHIGLAKSSPIWEYNPKSSYRSIRIGTKTGEPPLAMIRTTVRIFLYPKKIKRKVKNPVKH